jgi:hypothetical protein
VCRLKSKMKVILQALGFTSGCWLDVLSLEKSDGDQSFQL